jgi:preprotein translocase subunit SecY
MLLKSNQGGGIPLLSYPVGWESTFSAIVIIMSFTAGTALMMWLGEQVNEKGIGNGISILLFAGIVSRMPEMLSKSWSFISIAQKDPENYGKYFFFVPLFFVMFLGLIWIIVFMNDAERRIPIQYAKRLVGRKMYGGQNSRLPIKVGLSGVMPVIFASTILSLPSTISIFARPQEGSFLKKVLESLSYDGWLHSILYCLLIIMFSYFYVTIQYNPIEIANDLRQSNGTIPGIRPGKPTADFISRVLSKVTLMGALFLAFIALLPMIFGFLTQMHALSINGTSIIILVGVALETVKQMETQMMQRHYKGFLD